MKKLNWILFFILITGVSYASYVIPDLSVTTSKLAAGAVTQAKLATKTVSRAGFFAFTTSSTSYVDVTGSSVTLTTTGRPVMISVCTSVTNSIANSFGVSWAGTTANSRYTVGADYILLMDGSQVGPGNISMNVEAFSNSSTASANEFFPSSGVWFNAPSAGSHTYKLQLELDATSNVSTPLANINGDLCVVEL